MALRLSTLLLTFTTLPTSPADNWSASSLQLEVPRTRLATVGDRTFSAAGSRLWNSLPRDVTDCQTVETFRRHLKHFLFSLSFPGHQLLLF